MLVPAAVANRGGLTYVVNRVVNRGKTLPAGKPWQPQGENGRAFGRKQDVRQQLCGAGILLEDAVRRRVMMASGSHGAAGPALAQAAQRVGCMTS